VEPPKIGEGVSGLRVGAENDAGLASTAPSLARTVTERTRLGAEGARRRELLAAATRALLATRAMVRDCLGF
jgi:hypothetical protein